MKQNISTRMTKYYKIYSFIMKPKSHFFVRASMLTLLIFLTTFVISGTDVKPHNEVERKLLTFFTKWRNDNISFPLPHLGIINISPLDGQYTGKAGVNITYSTSDMQLFGMNNFSVVDLKVLLGLFGMYSSGVLWIPKLVVIADDYKLHGHAFHIYTLNGSGKLYIDIENIHLSFVMMISSNGTSSTLTKLKFDFTIHEFQANLENSSWPINKVLNKEGVKIIEGYREEILTAAENSIVWRLDQYLEHITPIQLLDMILE